MGCPLCQEPLHLCPLALMLQWVLPRQELPFLCMCPQEVPFRLECPLPLDPWAQTGVIILRVHPLECLRPVCPQCLVWEARHPTDFHPRWEYHQTGCIRRLIQVGASLSQLFSCDPLGVKSYFVNLISVPAGFPGRPGSMSMRGRGRGRIPMGGPPGVPPGMPPSGEFPQGIDER